ncbi:MAG: DUF3592 domain-containing protein [Omnitrophica WOR_2 bacterium]
MESNNSSLLFFYIFILILALLPGAVLVFRMRSYARRAVSKREPLNLFPWKAWAVIYIFFCLFLAAGLTMLGWSLPGFIQAKSSQSWPSIPARITFSEIEEDRSIGLDALILYRPDIHYTYEVGGQIYTSRQLSVIDVSTPDKTTARDTVGNYPVGKPAYAYYNPKNPTQAVLVPGLSPGVWVPLEIGGSFTAVGLVFFTILIRVALRNLENPPIAEPIGSARE